MAVSGCLTTPRFTLPRLFDDEMLELDREIGEAEVARKRRRRASAPRGTAGVGLGARADASHCSNEV